MSKKGNVKVVLNMAGLNEIMKSPEMQAHLQKAGERVAQKAGPGFEAHTHVADYTALCYVDPVTREAEKDNYENNTLLKAVSSTLPLHK